ncbi:MAG: hypothetical protein JW850_16910 [Thermoflexales bacterium]|nr:hypothetical protein [Thermoflexales bacterium]
MSNLAVDFVTYVLGRLPANAPWPKVWDEAQAVARRRAFRGMGYFDLLRAGVPLSLNGTDKFSQIVDEQKHYITV